MFVSLPERLQSLGSASTCTLGCSACKSEVGFYFGPGFLSGISPIAIRIVNTVVVRRIVALVGVFATEIAISFA